ncbi:ABC transporter substrate-binding protein [Anaeroselena agilis]|uniref:ABC transporter substrate binding protein n=1 Tax=Anaeroselena agilis TaxID=3063788 RepID=A0ABU3P2Y9_9FIRM|nr:ABC transporter substrate binding protein [Selenomonadales bacterium 4137-cl]
MIKHRFLLATITAVIAGTIALAGCASPQDGGSQAQSLSHPVKQKKYKVFHVMSYHSPWEWTDTQFAGFKDALKGLDVEYRVYQMDAKNRSSAEWLQQSGREAEKLIAAWQPDLVYTSDDEAQKYVTSRFAGGPIPFVFSGVNKSPREYGLSGSRNVTGVLEVEHFVESAALFHRIVPNAVKVAVVFDDAPIWEAVGKRMKDRVGEVPGLEFVTWDTIHTFAAYQAKIKEYEQQVDGICLVGIFNFKDERGHNVHYRDVLKWTAENSRLPDFSFWLDRANFGTLCVVSVSGYEQGLAAGRIAREILVDGKIPASIPIAPTTRGQAAISLARAKSLGLKIDSKALLSTKVFSAYGWR